MKTRTAEAYQEELFTLDHEPMPLRHIRSSVLLLVLIVVAVIWAVMSLLRPDFLPIKKVRVEGEFHQLAPDRLEAIVTDTVRGGFFNVNVDVIQKVLLQDPWVHRVTVLRNWPDSLTVQVTEQVAAARWSDKGLINPDGELFMPAAYTFPEGLPVLRGPDETYSQVLAQYRNFSEALAATGFTVSALTLNDRRSWSLHLTDGPLLVLGRMNAEQRLAQFVAYLKSVPGEDPREMETVDLRYTNGFAVRWKNNLYQSVLGQDHHG